MGGRKAMPQEKKNTLNIYTIPKEYTGQEIAKKRM